MAIVEVVEKPSIVTTAEEVDEKEDAVKEAASLQHQQHQQSIKQPLLMRLVMLPPLLGPRMWMTPSWMTWNLKRKLTMIPPLTKVPLLIPMEVAP